MSQPSILIAGVGNLFLGDDAFGVAVVQQLQQRRLPEAVRVVDFGIRGLDLAYALLDDSQTVILVDATPRGGPPGTLYVLEPEREESADQDGTNPMLEMHNLDPVKVLRLVAAMGGRIERLLVVGCEPAPPDAVEEMQMEMSAAVRSAVAEAVVLIESLIAQVLRGEALKAK
jgi:hydrogenase maturation protease